jgi:hypothetical protein
MFHLCEITSVRFGNPMNDAFDLLRIESNLGHLANHRKKVR